jgi:2-amino-4-hydroxy-6-hydroxymethyldihydropteridine diphosphokinase
MPYSVLIALGSNLGDRGRHLRQAVDQLRRVISVVRLSPVYETAAVDAPPGSPPFLNMVLAGHTSLSPETLLARLMTIERHAGRRRGVRNAPRPLDLDLILHSAHLLRTPALTLPHPRYLQRQFVLQPLRDLALGWVDPRTGVVI